MIGFAACEYFDWIFSTLCFIKLKLDAFFPPYVHGLIRVEFSYLSGSAFFQNRFSFQ